MTSLLACPKEKANPLPIWSTSEATRQFRVDGGNPSFTVLNEDEAREATVAAAENYQRWEKLQDEFPPGIVPPYIIWEFGFVD